MKSAGGSNGHVLGIAAVILIAPIAMQAPSWGEATPGASTYEASLVTDDREGDGADHLFGAPEEPAETGAAYARLLYFEGGMSLRRPADMRAPGADVAVNTPLVPGDEIWTGTDGRAEIQLADGSMLRLDHDARLSLLNLSDLGGSYDTTTLLRLPNGSLYINADNFDARERRFQIDTPAGSIFLLSEGVFRIDVNGSGTTSVSSYRGVAELLGDESSVVVHSGERLSAGAGRPAGEARAFNTLRRDDFDFWAESRDDAIAASRSARGPEPAQLPEPVRPYASELSANGTWQETPEYGLVWIPAGTQPDWRPYYYGSWAWSPIGVVWVSSEPWGYAPYHYGRWHWSVGLGWFWAPGYVYSGAYVSWAVGPSWYGWCPTGYYGYPVTYAGYGGHHSHWNYVHHSHFYSHSVYHHTYSYSDVAKHRMDERSVPLRSYPRAHPRYRPEQSGAATYDRARNGKGALPRLSDRPSQRTSFRDAERRTYTRRASAGRGEAPPRVRLAPTSARPSSGTGNAIRPGRASTTTSPAPARRTRPGESGRPAARIQPTQRQAPAASISPVSGRSLSRPTPSPTGRERQASAVKPWRPAAANSQAPSGRSAVRRPARQSSGLAPATRPHLAPGVRAGGSNGRSRFVMVDRNRPGSASSVKAPGAGGGRPARVSPAKPSPRSGSPANRAGGRGKDGGKGGRKK